MAGKSEDGVGRKDLVTFSAEVMARVDTATYRGRQALRKIEELAASIAAHGQEEPGGARRKTDDSFALVYGHRRFAAMQLINADPSAFGLAAPIPYEAKVLRITHEEAMLRVAEENVQREDFTPMDKAIMASRLESVGQTREQIAVRLKESPARISQLLALLALPADARDALANGEGKLKESALRAMLKAKASEEEIIAKLPELIAGTVKGADLAADQRAARRATGKPVAWTMKDIHRALETIDTAPAANLLAILQGNLADPDGSQLRAILAE